MMHQIPVLWILWLFSSAGATPVGTYGAQLPCVKVQIELQKAMDRRPRVGMYRTMCLPTLNLQFEPPPSKNEEGS